MTRQHLIFDADDTLWENNIYFEEAFDLFREYLNHSTLSPDEIRAVLDVIEIKTTKSPIHGTALTCTTRERDQDRSGGRFQRITPSPS